VHPRCHSADPLPSPSSTACKAWQYACTTNSPLLLQAEGVQSGGPHKGAGLMGHVYTRKLEQAQQVRTQRINFVCASLSTSADCLPGSCLQGLCTACLSPFHASGCCHASFFATSGRSTVGHSALLGFKSVSQCCVTSCITWTSFVACMLKLHIFSIYLRAHVRCNFASLLWSLHRLELPSRLPSMAMCQSCLWQPL
jgi:hypothetical protein